MNSLCSSSVNAYGDALLMANTQHPNFSSYCETVTLKEFGCDVKIGGYELVSGPVSAHATCRSVPAMNAKAESERFCKMYESCAQSDPKRSFVYVNGKWVAPVDDYKPVTTTTTDAYKPITTTTTDAYKPLTTTTTDAYKPVTTSSVDDYKPVTSVHYPTTTDDYVVSTSTHIRSTAVHPSSSSSAKPIASSSSSVAPKPTNSNVPVSSATELGMGFISLMGALMVL
jgi:hypothetical protein